MPVPSARWSSGTRTRVASRRSSPAVTRAPARWRWSSPRTRVTARWPAPAPAAVGRAPPPRDRGSPPSSARERVEAVEIERAGASRRIAADGVVVTGQLPPRGRARRREPARRWTRRPAGPRWTSSGAARTRLLRRRQHAARRWRPPAGAGAEGRAVGRGLIRARRLARAARRAPRPLACDCPTSAIWPAVRAAALRRRGTHARPARVSAAFSALRALPEGGSASGGRR